MYLLLGHINIQLKSGLTSNPFLMLSKRLEGVIRENATISLVVSWKSSFFTNWPGNTTQSSNGMRSPTSSTFWEKIQANHTQPVSTNSDPPQHKRPQAEGEWYCTLAENNARCRSSCHYSWRSIHVHQPGSRAKPFDACYCIVYGSDKHIGKKFWETVDVPKCKAMAGSESMRMTFIEEAQA